MACGLNLGVSTHRYVWVDPRDAIEHASLSCRWGSLRSNRYWLWRKIAACSLLLWASASYASPASFALSKGDVEFAKKGLEALKAPDYGVSRCNLSPLLSLDQVTVAVSSDRLFSVGDRILEIGGIPLDAASKTPVKDLLMTHASTDSLSVKVNRHGRPIDLMAQCSDTKPLIDLLLEALYAASKLDAQTCATKLEAAAQLHALDYRFAWLSYDCRRAAGRVTADEQPRQFYEIQRLAILQAKASADSLSSLRAQILTAVNNLHQSPAGYLADDLKQQYDEAVASATQQ